MMTERSSGGDATVDICSQVYTVPTGPLITLLGPHQFPATVLCRLNGNTND